MQLEKQVNIIVTYSYKMYYISISIYVYNNFQTLNFQNITPIEQQNIMASIEENTERLDLMQKTLAIEEKQKKRVQEAIIQKQKQIEEANRMQLYEGNTNINSILTQEEAHRKQLVDVMMNNANPSIAPIVKVVNNVQGMLVIKEKCYPFLYSLFKII